MSTVRELLATNDEFREVADLLFGGGGDELITKMNPAQSDVAAADKKKRKITAGLSAVGAGAGAAGLALGGHNISRSYKMARGTLKAKKIPLSAVAHLDKPGKAPKMPYEPRHAAARPAMSRGAAFKHALGEEKLATGLIPLEVAGLTGEVAATKILHADTKKKTGVSKDLGELVNNARERKGELTRATIPSPKARKKGLLYTKKTGGKFRKLPTGARGHAKVEKSDRVDVTWSGEIAKANEEKQQIFGWASVIEVNGEPVVDLQGDRITAEEMEKAGYEYVMKSRKGGDMHPRDDWQPIQKSEMIESFIVTDEKREAFGLGDDVPTGWWVGFQVRDPEVWAKVKSGERTGFSIHGHGKRSPG